MGYRVCKSTGVIHAFGENFKKVCGNSKSIKEGNYETCRSKAEAEMVARENGNPPRYCKHCDFRDALQEEANY